MHQHEAQDAPLLSYLPRRRRTHGDALGVHHLAHHAARAVRGRYQDGIETKLLGGDGKRLGSHVLLVGGWTRRLAVLRLFQAHVALAPCKHLHE